MFKSYRPKNKEELLKIINDHPCHIFAGGTDLMIRKRQWQGAERKFSQDVVYISHLNELQGIMEKDDYYEIGTLTTQTQMVESHLPDYIKYPYSLMSHPAIRNIATVGGNIVNAASVADSLPIMYALDAVLELESVEGQRRISVEDFILDKYKTDRKSNEILTKVLIPKLEVEDFFYQKLGQRKASILSKVSVYIVKSKPIRIAIGAINPKVIRSERLEKDYYEHGDLQALVDGLKDLMHGVDDKRSTKHYKETVAIDLIKSYLGGYRGL